jgi:curved DNA-binding protein CbpA
MSASYYQILGVAPTASSEELSRAYRQLALQHHPDLGGEAARMVDLNRAYEVLGDPLQRRLYDEYLQLEGAVESPAPVGGETDVVPQDEPSPVEPPPAAGEASWALGVLRSLLRLADGLASVLLGIMATDSLPWLICYGLVLLAIAALVNSFFSGLRFP